MQNYTNSCLLFRGLWLVCLFDNFIASPIFYCIVFQLDNNLNYNPISIFIAFNLLWIYLRNVLPKLIESKSYSKLSSCIFDKTLKCSWCSGSGEAFSSESSCSKLILFISIHLRNQRLMKLLKIFLNLL